METGTGKTIFIEYYKGWFYKYNEEDDVEEIDEEDLINLLEREKFIRI